MTVDVREALTRSDMSFTSKWVPEEASSKKRHHCAISPTDVASKISCDEKQMQNISSEVLKTRRYDRA